MLAGELSVFSIRFHRGLVVAIVASALLWAGIIAAALRLV
jgi:hypothetical protein